MSRRFGSCGPQLKRAGWDVVPIKADTKKCLEPAWQRGFSLDQVRAFASNGYSNGGVGLLARAYPGVDIDVRNEECAQALEVATLLELGTAPIRVGSWPKRLLLYRTDKPFSKMKAYLTDPQGNTSGDDGKEYAVEFLGEGQQFLIYGRHPDGHEYTWPNGDGPGDVDMWELTEITAEKVAEFIAVLPIYLPAGWTVRTTQASANGAEDSGDAFANFKLPLDGWDADRIRDEIVPYLDVEMNYDDWLLVGQVLHHQFQGSDEGCELWDEIFQFSSKYGGPEYGENKYRSFKHSRGDKRVATLASIIAKTKPQRLEAVRQERVNTVEIFRQKIEACSDASALQDEIAASIANNSDLIDIEREMLAKAIAIKAKALGASVPIGTVRGWVRNRTRLATSSGPDWAKEWVYVTEGDKFLNLVTKEEVTAQGFRAQFNRLMPLNPDGTRERADLTALEIWGMPTVAHKSYMPSAGPTFEMFGLQWANLYRPESVPDVHGQFSQDDLDAIDLVKQHLEHYLEEPRERELLLSWLGHNVQHPGTKIRWAPYICGVAGDGKSFFSELVAVAMGGQNVRALNGSTLESNFTDWAVGYAVVAIEEMKQHGHNRYDIMNRLKPFITNTVVEIHPKGRASYTAPNVSNYLIFSNYLDGAPVDAGDRRYMFLKSQLTTDQAKELTEQGYFGRLFSAIRNHPGAIREWLLGVQPHAEFDPNGRAPDTHVKNTVVEMSKTDLQSAAEDVIEEGAMGVTRDVISSPHLLRELAAMNDGDKPSTTRVNTMLTQLGYTYLARKRWRGKPCRIWVRTGSGVDEKEAIRRLDQSVSAPVDFLE